MAFDFLFPGLMGLLGDIHLAQKELQRNMTTEFANVQTAMTHLVEEVTAAIAKLGEPRDNPVDVQAVADLINSTADSLHNAVTPPVA